MVLFHVKKLIGRIEGVGCFDFASEATTVALLEGNLDIARLKRSSDEPVAAQYFSFSVE